jgi:hypothetical protein
MIREGSLGGIALLLLLRIAAGGCIGHQHRSAVQIRFEYERMFEQVFTVDFFLSQTNGNEASEVRRQTRRHTRMILVHEFAQAQAKQQKAQLM